MSRCLFNLMMILVAYLIQINSLKAGCMDGETPVIRNNKYDCVTNPTLKEISDFEKELKKNERKYYLKNKYPIEVQKFENNEKDIEVHKYESNEKDIEVHKSVPEPKEKDPIFTHIQDKKTWQEAKEHCTGLGMRLPTEKEVAFVFQSGLTKKWNSGIGAVWTDKENSSMNFKNHFNFYTKDSMLGFTCLNSSFSLTESQDKNLPIISKWIFSEYLGSMKWDEANGKCSSSGMRLPTIAELKEAYNAGITKSWQKDRFLYWSSTPYDAERYYVFYVDGGDTDDRYRTDNYGVRCRR